MLLIQTLLSPPTHPTVASSHHTLTQISPPHDPRTQSPLHSAPTNPNLPSSHHPLTRTSPPLTTHSLNLPSSHYPLVQTSPFLTSHSPKPPLLSPPTHISHLVFGLGVVTLQPNPVGVEVVVVLSWRRWSGEVAFGVVRWHPSQAARRLGVDFAPAMVGFDIRDGRSVPRCAACPKETAITPSLLARACSLTSSHLSSPRRTPRLASLRLTTLPSPHLTSRSFDGVVVCEEVAELLVEAAGEMQRREEDCNAHKQRQQATAMWRSLLRAMAVRSRILAEYGS